MAQITNLELLQAALAGYQQQLSEIEAKMADLRGRIGGKAAAPARQAKPKKSRLSPEARERIAAAQRLRWAKVKAAKSGKKAVRAKKRKAGKTGSAQAPPASE